MLYCALNYVPLPHLLGEPYPGAPNKTMNDEAEHRGGLSFTIYDYFDHVRVRELGNQKLRWFLQGFSLFFNENGEKINISCVFLRGSLAIIELSISNVFVVIKNFHCDKPVVKRSDARRERLYTLFYRYV